MATIEIRSIAGVLLWSGEAASLRADLSGACVRRTGASIGDWWRILSNSKWADASRILTEAIVNLQKRVK